MQPVTVLFAPGVDAALVELIDHVDVDSIPSVLDFLERIQARLVRTLSTLPEAGPVFQGKVNRPGFTGGQNSRRIARYGTESKEDLEAVFT